MSVAGFIYFGSAFRTDVDELIVTIDWVRSLDLVVDGELSHCGLGLQLRELITGAICHEEQVSQIEAALEERDPQKWVGQQVVLVHDGSERPLAFRRVLPEDLAVPQPRTLLEEWERGGDAAKRAAWGAAMDAWWKEQETDSPAWTSEHETESSQNEDYPWTK